MQGQPLPASHRDPKRNSIFGDQPSRGIHVQRISRCSGAGPPVTDAHSFRVGDPWIGLRSPG